MIPDLVEGWDYSVSKIAGCWEWIRYIDKHGYGRKSVNNKVALAHRVSFASYYGISMMDLDGMLVCHSCDNPKCVNPEHLFLGSVWDNILDMLNKGRHPNAQVFLHDRCKHGHDLSGSGARIKIGSNGNITKCCKRCQVNNSTKYRHKKQGHKNQ